MRIISRTRLVEYGQKHPNAEMPLDIWYRTISKSHIRSFQDIREIYPSADLVGSVIVFNIGGNNHRLITAFHFNTQTVYVLEILTHAEYSKNEWKVRLNVKP